MYERIVAMLVANPERYQRYREGMLPILASYGGAFRYDFEIGRTLRSDADHDVNRVFAITFPDRASHDAFFADPRYHVVRAEHFDASVAAYTLIAAYEH